MIVLLYSKDSSHALRMSIDQPLDLALWLGKTIRFPSDLGLTVRSRGQDWFRLTLLLAGFPWLCPSRAFQQLDLRAQRGETSLSLWPYV
jgi:hypothetical protein